MRGLVCRIAKLLRRRNFEFYHWRLSQQLDNAVVCLAALEALEDFRYFFIGGQSLEDPFSHMFLGPKLLDLLDQLFLCMLDVNFVNALGGLDTCLTPTARLFAITLQSVSLGIQTVVASVGALGSRKRKSTMD